MFKQRLFLILPKNLGMDANTTSIIVADSQYLIRFALKQIVRTESHLALVGEVGSEEELIELLQKGSRPDIIMMDYFEDGFQLSTVKKIRSICPKSSIIIISSDEHKENILQTLEWGVNGFLTKFCDEEEIRDAIKASINKDKFFCSKVLDYLLEKTFGKETEAQAPMPLSKREIEVVQLIARGLVAKEIASLLNLSPHTVYTHRKKIMKKLGLKSASELIKFAVQQGLVSLD